MARMTVLALTLTLAAATALTACGRKGPLETPSEAAKKAQPAPTPEPTPVPTPAPHPATAP